jgi:hypothetical protein
MAYADEAALFDSNVYTLKKITEAVNGANMEVGLEVNAQRTEYVLLSCHQNAGQNHDIKLANRTTENLAQLKYLGTTVLYQNLIQEGIKRRLNSGNAGYQSVQNVLSSSLLSKKRRSKKNLQNYAIAWV